MDKKSFGNIGENMAAELLEADGYRILDRNYRCKFGEIDIIAEKNDVICFVEVKTRSSYNYGRPCESVNYEKKKHIRRTAANYLNDLNKPEYISRRYRFDVIEIIADRIVNAF